MPIYTTWDIPRPPPKKNWDQTHLPPTCLRGGAQGLLELVHAAAGAGRRRLPRRPVLLAHVVPANVSVAWIGPTTCTPFLSPVPDCVGLALHLRRRPHPPHPVRLGRPRGGVGPEHLETGGRCVADKN